MKIALLNVATGKYISFIPPLWESAKKFFMPGHEVHHFLFTDSTTYVPEENETIVPQQHIGWPGSTLFRYNFFEGVLDQLEAFDYIFYCDADMRFVDTVGEEILSDLVATLHPGYYNKPVGTYPYETNPLSKAFVKPENRKTYFYGAFNGGSGAGFCKLIRELAAFTAEDYKKGLIAVWHDESHINRYFSENAPTKVLDPSYSYPESWGLPFKPRLLALDKNHNEMRT
jgi:histo-blood group ABO system transferase